MYNAPAMHIVMMASNAAQEDAAVISWRHCDVITAVTGVMKPLLIRTSPTTRSWELLSL